MVKYVSRNNFDEKILLQHNEKAIVNLYGFYNTLLNGLLTYGTDTASVL